jgi:isoleucyl-tRNA synthetase
VPTAELLPLDRWAIDRAWQLQQAVIDAYATYQFHIVYQRVHHLCSVDLGSFYLDVLKDRQYTCQEDSLARRSGQTAMFHIAEALVRWLAPILSFTAEEIWRHLPGPHGESVFLETWYEGLTPLEDDAACNREFWELMLKIRDAISKAMEGLRSQDAIGSSLDAEVELHCDTALFEKLSPLGEELRFLFINSNTTVHRATGESTKGGDIEGLTIKVAASCQPKCGRCWHHRADVGTHAEHPELCGRCVDNVAGAGEIRRYG